MADRIPAVTKALRRAKAATARPLKKQIRELTRLLADYKNQERLDKSSISNMSGELMRVSRLLDQCGHKNAAVRAETLGRAGKYAFRYTESADG